VWLVVFVCFVATVLRVFVADAAAQAEFTEADLEVASVSRTVRVGALATGGRVATMPLEVYVARVLAGEGEPRAADAAQQALAIAIRTFALANTDRHGRDGFDLCDTTHCQVVRGSTPTSRRATMLTAGQVLTFEGQPAELFYSASCGGRSESASAVWPGANYPYLRSVPDDVHEDDMPWTLDVSLDDVRRALARAGFEGNRLRDVRIEERSESGRVTRLHLPGLRPEIIAGDQLRAALGTSELRSTAFAVSRRGNRLRFTGRGYGHGVGMCVIGAGRRASRGESVTGILAHYYPGLPLTRLLERLVETVGGSVVGAGNTSVSSGLEGSAPAGSVIVRVPASSPVPPAALELLTRRAHEDLATTLGTSVAPITVRLHDSMDGFRLATGRPWWVSASADGTSIDLAPAAVLNQRDGLEAAVRQGVAELLVSGALVGRSAWVRIGAARYFARKAPPAPVSSRAPCPSGAELMLAISPAAQRDAEVRAEACFSRALARTRDWRAVR
jgi:stage II sporulation protein D